MTVSMKSPGVDHVDALRTVLEANGPEPAAVEAVLRYTEGQPDLADNPPKALRALSHAAEAAKRPRVLDAVRERLATGLLDAIARAESAPELHPAPKAIPATLGEIRFAAKLPATFRSTADVTPDGDVLAGQDRAVAALERALRSTAAGQNAFVTAEGGAVLESIAARARSIAKERPTAPDLLFLHNFENTDRPVAVQPPAGVGRRFAAEMAGLERFLHQELPTKLDERLESTAESREKQAAALVSAFEAAETEALASRFGDAADAIALAKEALRTGQVDKEKLDALPEAVREEFVANVQQLAPEIQPAREELQAQLSVLDRDGELGAIAQLVKERLDRIRGKFSEEPTLVAYLDRAESRMTELAQAYVELNAMRQSGEVDKYFMAQRGAEELGKLLRVNLAVDNARLEGAPVVVLDSSSLEDVFGYVTHKLYANEEAGAPASALDITPGALHRANGGILVLNLRSLLESGSWNPNYVLQVLLEAVDRGVLDMSKTDPMGERISGRTNAPDVPLNVKLVVAGPEGLFHLATELPEFKRVFGTLADLTARLPNDEVSSLRYAQWLAHIAENEGLPHFDRSAVERLLEHQARAVDDNGGLLAPAHATLEVIRQAAARCRDEGLSEVSGEHVAQTIADRAHMLGKSQQRLKESMSDGSMHIATRGTEVGQVNGLWVSGTPAVSWGGPGRVTVSVFAKPPSAAPVENIEEHAGLSGELFTKANAIINSWVLRTFGRDDFLYLGAKSVMEQTYVGIDGDSATSTIAYGLLSELSGVPIRQGIGVTGSMDRNGRVQVVGGLNEKIEGFFDTCLAQGELTGEQGVIIPEGNLRNLVLRPDVMEAIEAGRFHVYPVRDVRDGIEILTGVAAGDPAGEAGEPTVFGRAKARIAELRASVKRTQKEGH